MSWFYIILLIEVFAFLYLRFLYFFLLTLALILYGFSQIRYSLKILPLLLISYVQGVKTEVVTELKDIKKMMQLNDKGRGVECLFSQEGFSPMLSLESENGPNWERLRENYLTFFSYTPSLGKFAFIANQEVKRILALPDNIDSIQISKSTVKIFLSWLFCENHLKLEKKENITFSKVEPEEVRPDDLKFVEQFVNDDVFTKLYESSLEYRKHLAIKGKADPAKKQYAVDVVVDILSKSKYTSIPNFNWKDPFIFSIVMQPMIISPMINISDIAVGVKRHKDLYNKKDYKEFLDYIDYCIMKNHPFVVLERYNKETNTQYYLEIDTFHKASTFDPTILNYAMGPRACLGRVIARIFLEHFFQPIVEDMTKFYPEVNHLYSGRDNDDNMSFQETIYQVTKIFGVIFKEYLRARRENNQIIESKDN